MGKAGITPELQSFNRLPPVEVRKYNPEVSGLIETPLDTNGLVDLDALVDIVKKEVDPSFTWTSTFNDVHHLQWFANLYFDENEDKTRGLIAFRELANRKAYVPRVFHNWVHYITAPPPVPSEEVRTHSIEAQSVAMGLAHTASLAVRLTRMVGIPAKRLEERLDKEFINYTIYLENAREVPKEFSLVAIKELEARNAEEMLMMNKKLGRLALDKIPTRDRSLLPAV